jgi:hypothetical protein
MAMSDFSRTTSLMVTKVVPAALACSTKSFQASAIVVLEDDGGHFFSHVSVESAHAVAGDEGHHVVFKRDEIVRLHAESIVAESAVERTMRPAS